MMEIQKGNFVVKTNKGGLGNTLLLMRINKSHFCDEKVVPKQMWVVLLVKKLSRERLAAMPNPQIGLMDRFAIKRYLNHISTIR